MTEAPGPVLWRDEDRGLHVESSVGPDDRIAALLDRVEWGTSGPRFRMHHLPELVHGMPEATWIRLWRGETLLGCYALRPRRLTVDGRAVDGRNRMLLAIDPDHAERGLGRILANVMRRHFLDAHPGPRLLYGYIETGNHRSMRLARDVGYRSLGTFRSVLWSRQRPRPHPAVRPASSEDDVSTPLIAAYGDHALSTVADTLRPARTWVLAEGGRLLASVQVARERWTITHLPGRSGRLLLRLLPALRPALPFFQGRDFRYLRLSHAWAAPGQESAFDALLGAVLHATDHRAALAFADPTCPVMTRLERAVSPGLIGRLGLDPTAHVMADGVGLDEAQWAGLTARPLWISPQDPA